MRGAECSPSHLGAEAARGFVAGVVTRTPGFEFLQTNDARNSASCALGDSNGSEKRNRSWRRGKKGEPRRRKGTKPVAVLAKLLNPHCLREGDG